MKLLLILLVAFTGFAATPYSFGTTLRLDNGATSLKVTHTVDGVEQSYVVTMSVPLPVGATYSKVTLWGSKYYLAGYSESNCANPCNIQAPLHYGSPTMQVRYFDGGNNQIGQTGLQKVPQYIPPPIENPTMPLELIGFEGYERHYKWNARASADLSGTERLYLRIHRPAYACKAQVQVNNGAWTCIEHANVTKLGTHASWTGVSSLDFGQSLLELSMPLTASQVQAGANIVRFRFAKEARDQSGFRIVDINFLQADLTVSQVAVSGNIVTVDTSTPHGYSTGDDVRIEAYPGVAWRVNGVHTITVTDSDTFTFTIPESDGRQAGTKAYAGVKVAKLIIDVDDFVEEDVNSWVAPTGGNAGTGATLWANQANLAPEFPGQQFSAKCKDCHARNGLDLKYFNYSNHSIMVRAMFHGWTEQQAKDVAAYIRGNVSSNPGRPYNAVYQPCVNSTVVSAYDWAAACTYHDVLPNNAGMIEELFGATIEVSDWEPTRANAHFAQQRIPLQMLDWNDWLPLLHPADTYNSAENNALTASLPFPGTNLYWPTSQPLKGYNDMITLLQNNCVAGPNNCTTAEATAIRTSMIARLVDFSNKSLTSALSLQPVANYCQGNPPDTECNTQIETEGSQYSKRVYSVALWTNMKMFEVNHEWNLEKHGQSVWFTRTTIDRNSFYALPFQSSFNLAKAIALNGTIPGMFDGTIGTERIMSLIWYQYQGILNRQKDEAGSGVRPNFDAIQPIDVPYTYGYFFSLPDVGVNLPMMNVQWIMQQFQRYKNTTPDWNSYGGTGGHGWYWNAVHPQNMTSIEVHNSWGALPAEDLTTLRTAIIDTGFTKWTALACGDEANGTSGPFTVADWRTRTDGNAAQMPQYTNVSVNANNVASTIWHMIIMGRAFGVNSTTLNRLESCGAAWWPGATSYTLASGIDNTTSTFTLSSTPAANTWNTEGVKLLIGSENMVCTSRSGTTVSGCTRGTNGTTATSHSAGAAITIQTRWNDARTLGTCTMNGNNLTVNASCYQTPRP
jgi:hypothetical protein